MSMKNYFPTFAASTNDLKQNARNILKISKWFEFSPLAQNLKLNQAHELVAKSYGFNSYAAYTAHIKKYPTTSTQLVKNRLYEIIDCENTDDTLFLKTVHSYLITPAGCFNQVTIYEEPTPLLFHVIKNWTGEYEHDIFHALVSLNAIGMGVYCTHLDWTEEDTKYVYKSPVGGLVRSMMKSLEYYSPETKENKVIFKFRKKKYWKDLTLKGIDHAVSVEKPELDLGQLKKNLRVTSIEEMHYDTDLLDRLWIYTAQSKIYVDEVHSADLTGVNTQAHRFNAEHLPKDAVSNICLEIQDSIDYSVSLEIEGEDYSHHLYPESTEYSLFLYHSKTGLRFLPIESDMKLGLEEDDESMTVRHNLILDFIAQNVIKALEKRQYILANLWYDSDATLAEYNASRQ